jgi:hypothetical protein
LGELHIKVNVPIVMKTDIIGAIFMSENASTGFRTLHMDIYYHFAREFIEDGFIKMGFVRSVENDSGLYTKNVNQVLYEKHTKRFLEDSQVYSTSSLL